MSENLKLAYILKICRDDGTYFYEVFKSKNMAELFQYNYRRVGRTVYMFETIIVDPKWEW